MSRPFPGGRLAHLFREIVRQLPLVLLGVAGFAVVAAALHLILPSSLRLYAEERSEKLAILDEWHGVATTSAFGSSRVYNSFIPAAFDAELARAGLPVTSINLAVPGGGQTEQRALAREFLGHLAPPAGAAKVCLVLLELNAGINFSTIQLFHPRAINLYDADTVRFVAGFSGDDIDLERRVGRVGFALAAGGVHFANLGMLGNTLFQASVRPGILRNDIADDHRGFVNAAATPEAIRAVDALFQRRAAEPVADARFLQPGNLELLRDLAAATEVKGVQFAYFVMPTLDDLAQFAVYPPSIEGPAGPVPIIDLGRPDLYPQLFEREVWRDPGHLNEAGARALTRLLARELAKFLSGQPAPPRCGA